MGRLSLHCSGFVIGGCTRVGTLMACSCPPARLPPRRLSEGALEGRTQGGVPPAAAVRHSRHAAGRVSAAIQLHTAGCSVVVGNERKETRRLCMQYRYCMCMHKAHLKRRVCMCMCVMLVCWELLIARAC